MRIDFLKEFITFARILNVSQAARRLNMSQSGLSRHLIEMEKELGVELVSREKGMRLTPAGILFLDGAESIVQTYENTVSFCKQAARSGKESMTLQEYGGHPDVSSFLFVLAGHYRSHCPNITVEWKRLEGYDIVDSLIKEELDVAQTVIYKDQQDKIAKEYASLDIEMVPLYEEGVVVWLKKTHPLAAKKSINLIDLKETPIRTTSGKLFNPMRVAIQHLFESQNLTPKFTYTETRSFSDFYLVDADNSAYILPQAAMHDSTLALRKDMRFMEIEDAQLGFTTYALISSKNEKACVRGFKDFMKGYLNQNQMIE